MATSPAMATTTSTTSTGSAREYRPYGLRQLTEIGARFGIPDELVESVAIAARVLPFRVNEYLLTELIDWSAVPDDPIFRLVFPRAEMLPAERRDELTALHRAGAPAPEWSPVVASIRDDLNPHPAGQITLNAPLATAERPGGIQHKYPETILFFPTAGQTCHAYCTFCFRWPQFVGPTEQRFGEREAGQLVDYLRRHPEVRDVLFTGGDPLMMKSSQLLGYIDALDEPGLEHIDTVRIGTKALTYWPDRVLTDPDADELLQGFERVAKRRRLVVVAHLTHPRELTTDKAIAAFRRVRATGALIHAQGALMRTINDESDLWCELWTRQGQLGVVPYYQFMERDTGPKDYFSVPLAEAVPIFRDAFSRLPGLLRTVRGPVMSAEPGKVVVDGIVDVGGRQAFALRFLQARRTEWLLRPFFAAFDPSATWLDQLKPLDGDRFFFEA